MREQINELNFSGQNIYAGIDVHLRSWTVTVLSEHTHHKTFSQPASPDKLAAYLQRNFPGGRYHSVYEAGFSGFWTHYRLESMGIKNIVVNAADVAGTQKEKLQKDDAVDSRKLARGLRSGDLSGIHIPCISTMEDRSLVRARSILVKDMSRFKQRIKSHLYFYGIRFPDEFERSGTHWSRRFMEWLKEDVIRRENCGSQALEVLIAEAEQQRKLLLEVTRKIRSLSNGSKYADRVRLLRTIPGIGFVTSISLLTEFEDINRFPNTDHLAAYVGLVPNRHNSGEKENTGEMTFRGHQMLRSYLIESAWIAARLDPALNHCFNTCCRRMEPNKAIIKIARKLLNRIYFVLKNGKEYVSSVVK
jgi:transposase